MDEITHNLGICKTNNLNMPILTSRQLKLGIKKAINFILDIKTSQEFNLARKKTHEKELEL